VIVPDNGLAGDHFGRAMALRGRIAPTMMWGIPAQPGVDFQMT